MDPGLIELVELADLNKLLRAVDSLCARRAWDELLELADRCDDALERGKQLWPISAHIEYRIALEGPGDYAAATLDSQVGRFTLGPLTEVVASTHAWAELCDHIETPQDAAFVAQERVLRGENLTGDVRAHEDVLNLPLVLQDWEPQYALATYRSDHVEVAEPFDPNIRMDDFDATKGAELDEPEIVAALLDLVQPWTTQSNGAARAAVAEGDAHAAISSLTMGTFRAGAIDVPAALRGIAWAAASGGAHGRRRGSAFGRSAAFFLGSLLCDLPWPPDPAELARELTRLRWWRWDEGEPEEGWVLRIAVEDPANGWAAAIAATDLLEDEEEQAG